MPTRKIDSLFILPPSRLFLPLTSSLLQIAMMEQLGGEKRGGEIEVKRATHLNKFVFPSLRIRVDLLQNSSPILAVFQICTLVAIRHFSTKEEKKRRKEKREREWSVGPILLPRFAPGEIFGGPDPFSPPGGGFAHIS